MFPKEWNIIPARVLLREQTDPEVQEALMYCMMTKFKWRLNLFTVVELESNTKELAAMRLSILSIICDDDQLDSNWQQMIRDQA